MFPIPFLCEEFNDISITRSQIVWHFKRWIDALAFKYFYFSAIFNSKLNKMADLTQCPSQTHEALFGQNENKHLKTSQTVGRYRTVVDIRADAVIRSKQTTLNHHVLFLFTFFRFVILCIYLRFFIASFFSLDSRFVVLSLLLFLSLVFVLQSVQLSHQLCRCPHTVACKKKNDVKIRLKSTNQFDMRRFILSACTNDRFRIYVSLLPFSRYVRNESRFFLITMRNMYPIRSVSTRIAETKKKHHTNIHTLMTTKQLIIWNKKSRANFSIDFSFQRASISLASVFFCFNVSCINKKLRVRIKVSIRVFEAPALQITKKFECVFCYASLLTHSINEMIRFFFLVFTNHWKSLRFTSYFFKTWHTFSFTPKSKAKTHFGTHNSFANDSKVGKFCIVFHTNTPPYSVL